MKKLLLAAVAVLAFAGSAHATPSASAHNGEYLDVEGKYGSLTIIDEYYGSGNISCKILSLKNDPKSQIGTVKAFCERGGSNETTTEQWRFIEAPLATLLVRIVYYKGQISDVVTYTKNGERK